MTTIGTSLVITGEVTSKEDITIHGQVKGQISMAGGHSSGGADGPYRGRRRRDERDHSRKYVRQGRGGRTRRTHANRTVKGTLIAPAVILREGATFNGKIQVEKKGGPPAVPPQRSAEPPAQCQFADGLARPASS